jgi:hypothetical protein
VPSTNQVGGTISAHSNTIDVAGCSAGMFGDAAIGPEELIRQGPPGTRASLRSPLTDPRANG